MEILFEKPRFTRRVSVSEQKAERAPDQGPHEQAKQMRQRTLTRAPMERDGVDLKSVEGTIHDGDPSVLSGLDADELAGQALRTRVESGFASTLANPDVSDKEVLPRDDQGAGVE
jgi:hypothetical protein